MVFLNASVLGLGNPPSRTERCDGLNNKILLRILQLRKDGQGEHSAAGFFGDRKSTPLIAKVLEGRLKVQAERIVNLRGNTDNAKSFP
jgi:hypothetical protein